MYGKILLNYLTNLFIGGLTKRLYNCKISNNKIYYKDDKNTMES